MQNDKLLKIIGPLSFKIADKFFKFVSWGILVVAIRYVYAISQNASVRYLDYISTTIFSSALIIQAIYVAVRHPDTLGIPVEFHNVSKTIQFMFGLFIAGVLTSPYLFTDQILDAILQSRLK